mmetsp:Transcript_2955/g.7933  ORF Transcript_2955/g.7933 Transcript_2955/m.7933 type:complete len:261 (+) Transcript_2955:937-1719(+)
MSGHVGAGRDAHEVGIKKYKIPEASQGQYRQPRPTGNHDSSSGWLGIPKPTPKPKQKSSERQIEDDNKTRYVLRPMQRHDLRDCREHLEKVIHMHRIHQLLPGELQGVLVQRPELLCEAKALDDYERLGVLAQDGAPCALRRGRPIRLWVACSPRQVHAPVVVRLVADVVANHELVVDVALGENLEAPDPIRLRVRGGVPEPLLGIGGAAPAGLRVVVIYNDHQPHPGQCLDCLVQHLQHVQPLELWVLGDVRVVDRGVV